MLAPRIRGLHVLLVDDDDSLRRALARTMRLAGFEVEAFESVEALLARGVPEGGACLVLDVDLPGIGGIEFKRTLVAASRDLPTIFITALEPADVGEPLAALAPVAVLYKPFNKEALLEAIGRAGNWHGAHSMTLRHKRTTRLLAALALFSAAVLPQAALTQPAGIEPQAEKLLKASMAFLAAQKRFSVDTRNTIDVVLTSGQKLQFGAAASASVQRPNKMRAERKGDLVDQVFVYDGKSLTLYNPGQKYYATVGAPGTLDATLDFARTKLDVIAPGGDLLYANAYEILIENVTSGFVVGKAVVEGVRCDHLAFRGAEVDWQIWLQEGKQPLPRKWLITTKDIAGSPEFEVVMTKWNLAPNFADGMFDFKPSKGARKVDFLPLIGGTAKPR